MTNNNVPRQPWKASLHGGHSSGYCDHAQSTLEEIIEAALAFGYTVFGVTEHAPRVEAQHLFAEEAALGWTVDTLDRLFRDYAVELDRLTARYADRLHILKGFEADVVPVDRYPELMRGYKETFGFDYIVGSVHYVGGIIVDYTPEFFEQAAEASGGLEALGVAYYRTVADMAGRLKPDVVGHFDFIRRGFPDEASAFSPPIHRAALEALEAIRDEKAILDVNTAGFRKGMGSPFPGPVYLRAARDMGIGVCFGDDSHQVAHVGAGIEDARTCLLECGHEQITVLERGAKGLNRRNVPLVSNERSLRQH